MFDRVQPLLRIVFKAKHFPILMGIYRDELNWFLLYITNYGKIPSLNLSTKPRPKEKEPLINSLSIKSKDLVETMCLPTKRE